MSAPNRTGFRMACAASKQPDFHTSNCERFHARRIRRRGEYPTPPLENHHRFCACGQELDKRSQRPRKANGEKAAPAPMPARPALRRPSRRLQRCRDRCRCRCRPSPARRQAGRTNGAAGRAATGRGADGQDRHDRCGAGGAAAGCRCLVRANKPITPAVSMPLQCSKDAGCRMPPREICSDPICSDTSIGETTRQIDLRCAEYAVPSMPRPATVYATTSSALMSVSD